MNRFGVAICMAGIALGAALAPAVSYAQETNLEQQARLARRAAGLRVATWNIDDAPAAVTTSSSLLFEGFLRRGLDNHLALENSAAVWQRTILHEQPLPLGGSDTLETRIYVIPLLTALKFYPFTTTTNAIEPYVTLGAGFALGVEDPPSNAIGAGGTSIVTGFGLKAGAGIEYHFSTAFGAIVGARYQWMKFGEELAGDDTFKGVGFEGGLTYRFH